MSALAQPARQTLLMTITLALLLPGCDWLVGLTGVDPTKERVYYVAPRSSSANTFTFGGADDFMASPKSPTTIELILYTSVPLDLGDDSADFAATATLSTWGGTPTEYPLALQRVTFTDPNEAGVPQYEHLVDPNDLDTSNTEDEDALKYKYAAQLSQSCAACVGEGGQALPAIWTITGTYSAEISFSGRCNVTYVPYLGPLVAP